PSSADRECPEPSIRSLAPDEGGGLHRRGRQQPIPQAELGRAIQEVTRVQNDLTGRLWTAFGQYAAARQRAERYRTAILPNATRAYRLSQDAFRGGQFEYLRVLQAQRAAAEANLEYIRVLSEAWRAASEIAGLLLGEEWPLSTVAPGGTL